MINKDHISSHAFKAKRNVRRGFFSPNGDAFFQPKLSIGPTDDIYEREADAVADQVMRMPEKKDQPFFSPQPIAIKSLVQTKCAACEEEEQLQRKEDELEEENMMLKSATTHVSGADDDKVNNTTVQRQESPSETSTPDDKSSESSTDPGINWFEMSRPFLTRGAGNLLYDPSAYGSISQQWHYNYNLFNFLGLGSSLAKDASNFFTPFAIDSALQRDFPLPWEVMDRELNTSTIMISPTLFNFDLGNLRKSFTMPSPFRGVFGLPENPYHPVQRKCAKCEEEENEKIQRKHSNRNSSQGLTSVESVLKTSGQPLDNNTRDFMEDRMGYDFSAVRIHNDAQAHHSSKDINALAYTHGSHVVFGSNNFQPQTESGRKLIAHELTHVVQQNGNSVRTAKNVVSRSTLHPGYVQRIPDNTPAEPTKLTLKEPGKTNWARQQFMPFSYRADKELPVPTKDVPNHPLMIWGVGKIFKLTEDEAAEIVLRCQLFWYDDNPRKNNYKAGELVNFRLSITALSNSIKELSSLGKAPSGAGDVFDQLVALQTDLSNRDYSFFLSWMKIEGVPIGNITDVQNLTPDSLQRMQNLVREFNMNKYNILSAHGLLDEYLLTSDVTRDTRFEELKDLLFTKAFDKITDQEKNEVLHLFRGKALTTALFALEESKAIGKREYDRYTKDDSALEEVAGIIDGYSMAYMQNYEKRILEFGKFRDTLYKLPVALTMKFPRDMGIDKLNNIYSTYLQVRRDIRLLFKTYHYGPQEITKLFTTENMTKVMAEAMTWALHSYVWIEPEELERIHYLPRDVDHPFFWKFKEKFPRVDRSISFAKISEGCIPIVVSIYPMLAQFDQELSAKQQELQSKGAVNKHDILKDVSQNFGHMQGIADIKIKIMEVLKDKPGKAEETKNRLLNKPDLVWEFQPLLYHVLQSERLDKNHTIYKIVDEKIKAVADRNFWETIALAALGIILGIAGILTGGTTTALGITLLAGSAAVSLIDFVITYEDYTVQSDAYAATFKIPFGTEQSSFGVIMSLLGLVLDVGDVLKALGKAGSAAAKAGKASTAAGAINELLANSKNMDEYASHLYDFLAENKLLRQNISKTAFVETMSKNWNESQKLTTNWKMREAVIERLPKGVKEAVQSKEFLDLPSEIKENIFKIHDVDQESFAKIVKALSSDLPKLKTIGFQVFANGDMAQAYAQMGRQLPSDKLDFVLKYYTTVGMANIDAIPEVLNIMNRGNIFSNADLALQVLTHRKLQQLLFNFHDTPETLLTLWGDFAKKYSKENAAEFSIYISKETPHANLMKLEESRLPLPKQKSPPAYKGLLTDLNGNVPKPKALEGLNEDLVKLKEAVRDPLNVNGVTDIKFVKDYDVEVVVGEHTFRRNKQTGRWCRFSLEVCNLDVDDAIDNLVANTDLANAARRGKVKSFSDVNVPAEWKNQPRYRNLVAKLQAQNVSPGHLQDILNNAIQNGEPSRYIATLYNAILEHEKFPMTNFRKLIEGLADTNAEVNSAARILTTRMETVRTMQEGVKQVDRLLGRFSMTDLAVIGRSHGVVGDVTIMNALDSIIAKTDVPAATLIEFIKKSAWPANPGNPDLLRFTDIVESMPAGTKHTAEAIDAAIVRSNDFARNVGAALADPVHGFERTAKKIFGDDVTIRNVVDEKGVDVVDKSGKVKKEIEVDPRLREGTEGSGSAAYAEIINRGGNADVLAAQVFEGGSINFAKWEVIKKVINSSNIPLGIKNSTIGELWSRINILKLQAEGFKPENIFREVQISYGKTTAKADIVAFKDGEMVIVECKAMQGGLSDEQKIVYAFLNDDGFEKVTMKGPLAEKFKDPATKKSFRLEKDKQ